MPHFFIKLYFDPYLKFPFLTLNLLIIHSEHGFKGAAFLTVNLLLSYVQCSLLLFQLRVILSVTLLSGPKSLAQIPQVISVDKHSILFIYLYLFILLRVL